MDGAIRGVFKFLPAPQQQDGTEVVQVEHIPPLLREHRAAPGLCSVVARSENSWGAAPHRRLFGDKPCFCPEGMDKQMLLFQRNQAEAQALSPLPQGNIHLLLRIPRGTEHQ